MPVGLEKKTIKEEGQDKEVFVVSFSNGAKAQIEDLQEFLDSKDPLDVVKLGISFVQRLKEMEDRKKKSDAKPAIS